VTGQSEEAAATAKATWGIQYAVLADPQLGIAAALRKRKLPVPFIDHDSTGYLGEATPGGEYEVGCYQPAILVLSREFECLFHWVATPGLSNLDGACVVRPSARRVLHAAQGLPVAGSSKSDRPYRELWQAPFAPLLFLLLLANGNFVRPRTLTNDASGKVRVRTLFMPLKLAGAVTAIAMAAKYVPLATSAGLAAYFGYITYAFGGWAHRAIYHTRS